MTKEDVSKALDLLETLLPHVTKKRRSDEMELAWYYAFSEQSYEQVKAAILEHARVSPYFPSVSELMKYISRPAEKARSGKPFNWSDYEYEDFGDYMEKLAPLLRRKQ